MIAGDGTGSSPSVSPRSTASRDEARRLHQRVVAGDEVALMELFDRTGSLVYCAALSMTGAPGLAEDITESLFVEYWSAPGTFDPERGPLIVQMLRRMIERVPVGAGGGARATGFPS